MAIGLSAALGQGVSLADELRGHREPEGFAERAHQIRAAAHEGYLELVVQRTVENLGKQVDEAAIRIELPDAQVATNLRTQGIVGGKVVWFQGELLDAELAKSRYEYLTGYGQAVPKDPAWLYWTSPNSLGLQLFPCPPHQPRTVEYRLMVPMPYANGRYSVALSPLGSDEHRASFELVSAGSHQRVWLDEHELAPGSRVKSPTDATSIHVELVSGQESLVDGELAQVGLGTGRSFLRAELRAKPRLSSIPRDAFLVFLFDMSRSVGESWEPALRLFAQLAPHFPNARVAAWGFDRILRPITDGFVSFEMAKEKLEAFPRQTRNGSRIDLGLQAAAELIGRSKLPRERTRLFMLTDARVATRIGDGRIESAVERLPATAQLAEVSEGSCGLVHEPEMPWTSALEATSGTAWSASVPSGSEDCSEQVEELARPKRLFLKAISLEGAAAEIAIPETLDEGEAFVYEALISGEAKALGLEAKLWGKTISRQFQRDAAMSRIRAALATGNDELELTEPELRRLAIAGGAVTRLTSYLAIEPGVRPSREGFGGGTGDGQGFGSGHGRLGASHRGTVPRNPFNRQAFIEQVVDETRKACAIGSLRANVELETDLNELLDVVRAEVPDAPPSASNCLSEGLWAITLPAQFNQHQARFVVVR